MDSQHRGDPDGCAVPAVGLLGGLGVGVDLHRPVRAFRQRFRMAEEPRETRALIEPSLVVGMEPQPASHSRCFPESDLCWPPQRSRRRPLNSGSLQLWGLQRRWSLWQWLLSGEQLLSTGVWGIPETSSWRKPSFCTVTPFLPAPESTTVVPMNQIDLCLLLVPSLLHLIPKPA